MVLVLFNQRLESSHNVLSFHPFFLRHSFGNRLFRNPEDRTSPRSGQVLRWGPELSWSILNTQILHSTGELSMDQVRMFLGGTDNPDIINERYYIASKPFTNQVPLDNLRS